MLKWVKQYVRVNRTILRNVFIRSRSWGRYRCRLPLCSLFTEHILHPNFTSPGGEVLHHRRGFMIPYLHEEDHFPAWQAWQALSLQVAFLCFWQPPCLFLLQGLLHGGVSEDGGLSFSPPSLLLSRSSLRERLECLRIEVLSLSGVEMAG